MCKNTNAKSKKRNAVATNSAIVADTTAACMCCEAKEEVNR